MKTTSRDAIQDVEKTAVQVGDDEEEPPDRGLRRAHSLPAHLPQARSDVPVLRANLQPAKVIKPAPSTKRSLINAAKYTWLNALLVFVPISWALHFAGASGIAIFTTAALAIVPLSAQLSFATEDLAIRMGDTLGALLNCTFGNVVELIIAILALVRGELRIVQSAMCGSILSNCLLVLGTSFFVGGIRFHQQSYTVRAAQLQISMLGLSVLSITIPAAFSVALNAPSGNALNQNVGEAAGLSPETELQDVLKISRGAAFLLLLTYAAFLMYQLWTHAYLFRRMQETRMALVESSEPEPPSDRVFNLPERLTRRLTRSETHSSGSSVSTEEDAMTPKMSLTVSLSMLLVITAFTGVTAEWLVDSINELTEEGNVSKEFVGLILLPVIGNAAEHSTAIICSAKNKVDLAMGVAVGSSIQIALFVLPALILLGWAIGQPLTLYFDILATITLFISVVIVNWAIQDGKTNYIEGFVLIVVYVIIALVFWFYPGHQLEISV